MRDEIDHFPPPFDTPRLTPFPLAMSDELDVLVGRAASRVSLPEGLIDRVFSASARLLPTVSNPPLRLSGTAALSVQTSIWARFALAASVTIVCVMGSRLLQSPQRTAYTPEMALVLMEGAAPMDTRSVAMIDSNFANLDGTNAGDLEDMFTEMHSYDEVTGEMETIFADLYGM